MLPWRLVAHDIEKSESEWRQLLSPEQYHILREAGTERAFSGEYWNVHDDGTYHCAACDAPLFSSDTKLFAGLYGPTYTWQYTHPTPSASRIPCMVGRI